MYALFSDVVMSPIEIVDSSVASVTPFVIAGVFVVCILITVLVLKKRKKKNGEEKTEADAGQADDRK